jgi:hypothetical protein
MPARGVTCTSSSLSGCSDDQILDSVGTVLIPTDKRKWPLYQDPVGVTMCRWIFGAGILADANCIHILQAGSQKDRNYTPTGILKVRFAYNPSTGIIVTRKAHVEGGPVLSLGIGTTSSKTKQRSSNKVAVQGVHQQVF